MVEDRRQRPDPGTHLLFLAVGGRKLHDPDNAAVMGIRRRNTEKENSWVGHRMQYHIEGDPIIYDCGNGDVERKVSLFSQM